MVAGEPVDYDGLEQYLRALAYASRLELLHVLRSPRNLGDIRLAPGQVRPGENPERAISRQAIQGHLDKLEEVGIVVARDAPEGTRRTKEFVVNSQRLFHIIEELRKVAALTTGAPPVRDDTVDVGAHRAMPMDEGPKLVVVYGLREGQAFPLKRAEVRDGRGWIIGRKPGLHVSLDYDPYLSTENAEIVPSGAGFHLLDLRSSKNGTWLNWRQLGRDERVPLESGDVIGVGRSVLVFRSR